MAKPISFTPPPPPEADGGAEACDELDRLLVALHERGVLRLLNGLLAAGPEVAAVALDGLNGAGGQRAVRNAALLGTAATQIEPVQLETLVQGVVRGITAAAARMAEEPPGALNLARMLRDPDVRRGMNTMLGFLKAFAQQETGDHAPPMSK